MKQTLRAIIILFFATVSVLSQDQDKNSSHAERAAETRRKQIRKELAKLKAPEWAGDYYAGDGLGVNTSLILAPVAGFVFEWHGCLGLYDRNYGAVTFTNGRIRLSFTLPNVRKGFQGVAPEFIPVLWGPRHYLVPSDDVVGFCNNVNQRSEPRSGARGTYFLRRGDEKEKAYGSPELPDEFQQYILSTPIQAAIVNVSHYTTRPSVGDWKFKDTLVTLSVGANKGLRVGMELVVTEPFNTVESVRITKTEDTHSEGIMTQAGENEPGPQVGWRLSTRAPWNNTEPRN